MNAPPPPRLSGTELRRLLVLRSQLRDGIVGLPRRGQRDVLQALERARQVRQHGRATPWIPPAMTSAELIREVKWRVDAASLAEVTAGAEVLDRARRSAAAHRPRWLGDHRDRR